MGRVVVFGSIKADITVDVPRLPRPGETLQARSARVFPGGKAANQAVAAARAGAEVVLGGRVGTDALGSVVRSFLSGERIDSSRVRSTREASTGVAIVQLVGGANTITSVAGANARVGPRDLAGLGLTAHDVVLTTLGIPAAAVDALLRKAAAAGARSILNVTPTAHASRRLMRRADVLVVNSRELAALSGARGSGRWTETGLTTRARALRTRDDQAVVVTLGRRGVLAVSGSDRFRLPGSAVGVVDTTGAGDCLIGYLAAELTRGSTLEHALEVANRAASLSVQRPGAAPGMPFRNEVDAGRIRRRGLASESRLSA